MPPSVAREDLRLELRLPVAAHGAVGDDPAVVEGGERRDQRVERLAPRLQRVAAAGSSENPAPRFCQRMPVHGSTQPEPNSQKSDWM